MKRLFDWLFGCSHRRTTFPQGKAPDTYIVCLDCGKEFAYDWSEMRVADPKKEADQAPQLPRTRPA